VHKEHGGLSEALGQHPCLFLRRRVLAWCLLGVGVFLLLSVSWGWVHEGVRLAPAKMVRQRIEGRAPELALIDQSGQLLTLKELRGKVVLLTFTYSACAEVCPLITAAMAALQHRFTAAERQQVFFLSVTTQPEVDTPAVLHAYATRLGADLASWAFVTGHPQAVQEVWQAFGLTVKPRAKGG
jgi:cytochrome oxidase Cu insertion factor (SCO1/SenC/PrrC family)